MPPWGRRHSVTSNRRKKHKPEQIVVKLHDAGVTLNAGDGPHVQRQAYGDKHRRRPGQFDA